MDNWFSFKDQSPWVMDESGIFELVQKYPSKKTAYEKGSFIYRQGEDLELLHLLIEGRIKVGLISHDGKEKTLSIQEAGSFFGETAFFDNKPSFAFAEAMTDSVVLGFNKEEVTELFAAHSEIPIHLLASIGRKVRLLTFQLEYMSFMSLEKRIVAFLLCLFDTMGSPCPECNKLNGKKCTNKYVCKNGNKLNAAITDQELGNMLGVRREAVTKALGKLRKANLLYKEHRKLCLPDIDKIHEFLFSEENL